jgi:hypothetical protein
MGRFSEAAADGAMRYHFRRMNDALQIEPLDSADTGRCACCGQVTRKVWGFVRRDGDAHAAYFICWTVGHVFDRGADIGLILGRWGDGTSAAERYAVSLEYRILDNGPALMVVDAGNSAIAESPLVGRHLKRDDIIGGPLATEVFAVCDAVLVQDARLAALRAAPQGS